MGRNRRSYDGTERTGKRLCDILPEALKAITSQAGQGGEEIFRYWPEAIGEAMAPMTDPISFVDGILVVKVKSATLYSLLCQHERPRLLKKLQQKFSIRNLVFRR